MTTTISGPQESGDYGDDSGLTRVRKERNLRVLTGGAIAALAVLMGIAVFAQLSGATGDGADSPEEAVEALYEALAAEDLDAVAELLAPNERSALADPLFEAIDELVRMGALSDELDTSSIAGLDLSVTDLVLTVDRVDDDLANVHSAGTIVAHLDPAALPLGADLRRLLEFQGPLDELEPDPANEVIDLTITTVRRDGRWYVSLFHSIGEHVRLEQGIGPITGAAIEPRGADDPDAAISELLAAGSALDLAGIIAMVNPDEGEALYRYAPLLIEQVEAGLASSDEEFEFTIDGVEHVIDQQGDRAVATITAFTVSATFEGWYGTEVLTYRMADGCYHMSSEFPDGSPFEEPDPYFEMSMPPGVSYADGVTTLCPDEMGGYGNASPFDIDPFGMTDQVIVLDRVDGRWYVSPVSTTTHGWLDMLREIDSLAELFGPLLMPFGPGMSPFDTGGDESFPTETTVVVPDSTP